MSVTVEDMRAEEAASLLALNNGAVPEVNDLTADDFTALLALARVRVGRVEGRAAGFVMTMPPDAIYPSTNYRWFQARYPDFLYVDRVVVDPSFRGRGVGRALYEATIAQAEAARRPRICSEVNTDPPNPGSMAFHAALGFVPLEERANPDSGKTVAMMVCEL